jgi:phosphoglycolate phosphatase-like HAD superfamily hydrolase
MLKSFKEAKMTPVIRIDDQVMEELKKKAVNLGLVFGTPNEVLRTMLGLDMVAKAIPDQVIENTIEVEFFETDRKYNRILVLKDQMPFFPPVKEYFELLTDAGSFNAFLSSDRRIKTRRALKSWFDKHPELRKGDRLMIERDASGKRYKLSVVSKSV